MILCNNLRISLDRRESNSDIDFVSHAHSDHVGAVRSSKRVLASEPTVQLISMAMNREVSNGTACGGLQLIEAGHMLGSRQLYVEDSATGLRTTYTGDFQISRSRTAKPIKVIGTDTLIMDSTYSDSMFRFDSKEEVESAIQDWTARRLRNGIVIFTAYAMGKAQELISIMNEVGITPLVSRKISAVSQIYRNNGVRLSYSSAYDNDGHYEALVRDNFVGITDSRDLVSIKSGIGAAHGKRAYTAVATGFAQSFRFNTDAQFPLSDHADFWQSIDYIEATGAKRAVTYGANAESFARNLKAEGYDAVPFAEYSSKQINM